MPDMYKVTYKNGENEIIDAPTLNAIEPQITKAEYINNQNTQPPENSGVSKPNSLQDPLLKNSNDNGQTTLEPADNSVGSTINNLVVSPVKDYVNSFSQSATNPAMPGVLKDAAEAGADIIKNNPGTAAATLGSVLFAPEASPLMIGLANAAAFSGGRAIDKLHPLTSEPSDYSTESGSDNALDILGSSAGAGVGAASVSALLNGLGRVLQAPAARKAAYDEAVKAATDAYAKNQAELKGINTFYKPLSEQVYNDNTAPIYSEPVSSRLEFTPSNASESVKAELANADQRELDAIKQYMIRSNPDKYQYFKFAAGPTNEEARDFYTAIKNGKLELPTKPSGVNLISWIPNTAKTASDVLSSASPTLLGKLRNSLTNNFAVPAALESGRSLSYRPVRLGTTLTGDLGGYLLGSSLSGDR